MTLTVTANFTPSKRSLPLTSIRVLFGAWPIVIGLLVLAGWTADIPILKRIIDSPIPMNPITAIGFILLGIVIITEKHHKAVALLVAAAVIAIALLRFSDILYGTSFGVDLYLFSEKLIREPTFPNRLSPNAALNFLLIALATVALRGFGRAWASVGQALLIAVISIAVFAIVGYVFSIKSFYGVGIFTPMASITAVSFFITACGLLLNKTDEGVLRFIFSGGPSSSMAAYLLPASLAIPVILGWLRLLGQRQGYYDAEFGVALSVVINVILLFGITCLAGYFLHRTDARRRTAEAELQFLSSHDSLTGLYTRRILLQQLHRRISLAQRRKKDWYAVFYLDVDGLKRVNDQLGHLAGDALLTDVAQLLRACTRSSDTLARIGGDEFIILIEENEPGSEVTIAGRILERMPRMFRSEKGEVAVGLSIGIVTPPKNATDPEHIIKAADDALYEAKRSGKGGYVLSRQAW